MKQTITWDQLTELNFREVNEWQHYIGQKYHLVKDSKHWDELINHSHTFEDGTVVNMHTSYVGMLEKSTIGKMIEYIDEYADYWEMSPFTLSDDTVGCRVLLEGLDLDESYKDFESKHLANALWEAVRFIMEFVVDWSED